MKLKRLFIIFEIAVLVILFFWHFKLGQTRLFDADEFAHLHWGYSFSIGERPYTDFFYLFPPFFLFPIAAIFKIIGRVAIALIWARMFIFTVFLATSGMLFLLAKKLRNIQFGLFVVIIFAFLPLPFDKFIEVRPDIVATFLALVGMLFFIKGTDNCHSRESGNLYGSRVKPGMTGKFAISLDKESKWYFLSGLSYAASLAFVPKTIFFLVPVGLVFGYRLLKGVQMSLRSRHAGEAISKNYKDRHVPIGSGLAMTSFILGFVPVGLLLLLVISSFGNLSMSLYSMTRMASEVTKVLGSKFYMRPDIFFYPNDFYYGLGGWGASLIINLVIYISASIWAIGRFISSISGDKDEKCLREFIIGGTFFANLVAFVLFYPLKHAQYLIPVAPFIAFYFTDALWAVKNSFPKLKWPHELWKLVGEVFIGLFIIILVIVGWQMNQKKMQWGNKVTLDKLTYFLKTIPSGEPVYDLSGESIFFKNGYYFCCLPYGQYEEAIFFKIPDLEKDLARRGTKYVNLGWLGRLDEIPANHAKYIRENFIPVSEGSLLWKKSKL